MSQAIDILSAYAKNSGFPAAVECVGRTSPELEKRRRVTLLRRDSAERLKGRKC